MISMKLCFSQSLTISCKRLTNIETMGQILAKRLRVHCVFVVDLNLSKRAFAVAWKLITYRTLTSQCHNHGRISYRNFTAKTAVEYSKLARNI